MVNSILESFRQCCHGFLCLGFIFVSTSWMFCLSRWNFDLVLHKVENFGCLSGEFPAVKVPLLGHISFSGGLNHRRRSQTQVWCVLEAHAVYHTENAVFGMHDHRFPSEVSVFPLFFLHISPTEWFYWRENALKPTTNMLNVYILYISALVWLVFDVGFTGNTGSFSQLDVFKLKQVPERIIATTLTRQLECLTAKVKSDGDHAKASDVDSTSELL